MTSLRPKRVLLIGLSLSAAGMFWLATAAAPVSYLTDLFGPDHTARAGPGVVTTGTALAATANLPYHQAGLASRVLNTTRQLGGAVSLAMLVATANSQA